MFDWFGDEKSAEEVVRNNQLSKAAADPALDAKLRATMPTLYDHLEKARIVLIFHRFPAGSAARGLVYPPAVQEFCEYMESCIGLTCLYGPFWHYRHQMPDCKITDPGFDFRACTKPSWLATYGTVYYNEQGEPQRLVLNKHASFELKPFYGDWREPMVLYKLVLAREYQALTETYRRYNAITEHQSLVRVQLRQHKSDPQKYSVAFTFFADNKSQGHIAVPPVDTRFKLRVNVGGASGKSWNLVDGVIVPHFGRFRDSQAVGIAHGPLNSLFKPGVSYSAALEVIEFSGEMDRYLQAFGELALGPTGRMQGVDLRQLLFRTERDETLERVSLMNILPEEQKQTVRTILGRYISLNPKQREDMESFFSNRSNVTLTQGGPGAGKTHSDASLTAVLLAIRRKVLVCSPCDKGVEEALLKLDEALKEAQLNASRFRVVHFTGATASLSRMLESQESSSEASPSTWLEDEEWWSLVEQPTRQMDPRLDKYAFAAVFKAQIEEWQSQPDSAQYDTATKYRDLTVELKQETRSEQRSALLMERAKVESELLKPFMLTVDAVYATCSMSGHPILERLFAAQEIIVEEAAYGSTPMLIIPYASNKDSVFSTKLTGDSKQLSPVIMSNVHETNEARDPLATSLFAGLFKEPISHEYPANELKQQYRMHPDVADWPTRQFYSGKLTNAPSTRTQDLPLQITLRKFYRQMPSWSGSFRVAFDVSGGSSVRSEQWERTLSKWNKAEAEFIDRLVTAMLAFNPPPGGRRILATDIKIITPYAGQSREIRIAAAPELAACTTNAAQGSESSITIVSLGYRDPSAPTETGFVYHHGQLNLACTRARLSLVLVGNINAWVAEAQRVMPHAKAGNGLKLKLANNKYTAFVSLMKDLKKSNCIRSHATAERYLCGPQAAVQTAEIGASTPVPERPRLLPPRPTPPAPAALPPRPPTSAPSALPPRGGSPNPWRPSPIVPQAESTSSSSSQVPGWRRPAPLHGPQQNPIRPDGARWTRRVPLATQLQQGALRRDGREMPPSDDAPGPEPGQKERQA